MALAFTPLTGASTNASGSSLTTPSSTTPASGFIAVVAFLQSEGVTSVTDNKGNTYTKVWESSNEPGSSSKVGVWACVGAVGGSGHTFTANGTVQYGSIFPAYVTGYNTTTPWDTTPLVQGTGTGNSLALSQPTLAQANTLLLFPILVNSSANLPPMNPPSGFTSWFSQDDWNYWTGFASYLITSTASSATRTATGTNWNSTAGGILGIREAASGTSLTPGQDAIVLTGPAPTLVRTANQGFVPAPDAIVLTGQVPTLARTANQALVPAQDVLVITGLAPTVTQASGLTLTPGQDALILTGQAPTLARTANLVLTPAPKTVSLIGLAPTLVQTGAQVDPYPLGSGGGPLAYFPSQASIREQSRNSRIDQWVREEQAKTRRLLEAKKPKPLPVKAPVIRAEPPKAIPKRPKLDKRAVAKKVKAAQAAKRRARNEAAIAKAIEMLS